MEYKLEKNNRAIVVPIDFSEISMNAANHAADHASVFNNDILLVHIVEEGFFSNIFNTNGLKNENLVVGANARLDECIQILKNKYPNIHISKHLAEGKVYKTLIQIADDIEADCIIMGTNGSSGLESIIGSTAARVISHANCPVFVINEYPKKGKYEKLVLPIDLTKESRQKVELAIHIAKKYNSHVHIISEMEEDDFHKIKIKASVTQVMRLLEENGIKCTEFQLDEERFPGNLGEDTLKYADEIQADLIMIMTQQERGFTEFILGNDAKQIVNKVQKVPVLCINPTELKYTYTSGTGFYS